MDRLKWNCLCNILICRCMQKHVQHNKDERTKFFCKIYLSLYLKGFERVTKGFTVWEVNWRLNRTASYWPPSSSGYSSISFPFSWAAQPGAWVPSLYWDMVLIPASSLQLIWTSSRSGYIKIWCPPTFCERHNSHSIQPFDSQGFPLTSSTGCTCYLHRCISSFDSLAGVNILYLYVKMDLALNNQQWLICYKTKLNETKRCRWKLNWENKVLWSFPDKKGKLYSLINQ